jgi:hypothetical protein
VKRSAEKNNQNGSDDFVARAKRAMLRASDRAMADYKRFGIEPVISETSACKSASEKVEPDSEGGAISG